tara:strand:+ start:107 stop:304 length:198 start_codon:yes stop_codon:yes gene_type:complete
MTRRSRDPELEKALQYADEIESIFYDVNYRAGDDDEIKERFVDLMDAIIDYMEIGILPKKFYSET